MDSKLVFLIVLVGGVLALGIFFSAPPSVGLTENTARDFILDDVRQTLGSDVCVRSQSLTKTATGYESTLYVSLSPNTQCPSLIRREYTLLPIKFRDERLTGESTATSCPVSGLIVQPEEAIRYSAAWSKPNGHLTLESKACAFTYPFNGDVSCCPNAQTGKMNDFANAESLSQKGATWVVQWSEGDQVFFHAMDNQGRTIAAG